MRIWDFFTTFARLICKKRSKARCITMYWTLELATKIEDAPWPATKDELLDYALRIGAPLEVIENLQEIEDDEEVYLIISRYLANSASLAHTKCPGLISWNLGLSTL